jgi:UDP-N-acetylglucosamine 2-epimerase (non-hydrolysing)
MRTAVVLGTRPEIIKLAPVIRELQRQNLDFYVVHTGQHYSPNMDEIFFKELKLPKPQYNLELGSGSHGNMTGYMLMALEDIFSKEKQDVVIVQGDTNSVLAATLAASKLKIKIAHVEAGLRSGDWRQPEEKNRIIADHLSDYLFAPTENSVKNLQQEGLPREGTQKAWMTGNTVVDSLRQNIDLCNKKVLSNLGITSKNYMLVTAHREEYVDDKNILENTLKGLDMVYQTFNMPLIYPIHPRTKKRLENFSLTAPKGIKLIEPVGYLDFLQLEANAKIILTDSGGVQEEACIHNVPCVVLRDYSDRPETINLGAARLAGTDSNKILEATKYLISANNSWENPFGDGYAGKRIIDLLKQELN